MQSVVKRIRLVTPVDHGAAVVASAFAFGAITGLITDRVRLAIFAAAFHQDVSLQCVLAGKALITMSAREGLDSQMNPLMTLQVMIAVEALGALVAFERSVCGGPGKAGVGHWVRSVQMLRAGDVSTVETGKDARLHASHHRHGTIRAVDVGHSGPGHGGKGVRRPGLAREGQGGLSAGTLERHPRARVDSEAAMPAKRIGSGVNGGKAGLVGLVAGRAVERVHFLVIWVIGWQRCGRCSMRGVIEAHGDRRRTGRKGGGWRREGLRE